MRYILVLLMVCMAATAKGQTIERDEKDKYTGIEFRETSNEYLYRGFIKALRYKLRRAITGSDTTYVCYITYWQPSVCSVTEGDILYLLTHNDKVIKMTCKTSSIAAYLGGNWELNATYSFNPKDFDPLQHYAIKSIRIDMTRSYAEIEEIKEKHSDKLKESVFLLTKK